MKWFCRVIASVPTMNALIRTTTAVTMVSGGIKVCTEIYLLYSAGVYVESIGHLLLLVL